MSKIPISDKTEMALLGCVMLKPEILGWLDVQDACFQVPRNRSVWDAMLRVHRRGLKLDTVALEAELSISGVLEASGGLAHLSRVALSCVTADNSATYAKTLEEYRVTRETMLAAGAVETSMSGREPLFGEALLDSVISSLAQIQRGPSNEATSVSDTLPELTRRIIEDTEQAAKGIIGSSYAPTGIANLDEAIGGIPFGTVTAIGGRPGAGKSSILLNFAEHAASLGKTAVIFTTEDVRDRWNERMLAKHSGIDVNLIYTRRLDGKQLTLLSRTAEYVRKIERLHVVHAHGFSATDITRTALTMKADVVGVDYIQKVKSSIRSVHKLHEIIEQESKILGDFAGKHGPAVVALSQLSKDVEKENRRPTMSDLRYGDGLAQECKLGVLIHDPKTPGNMSARELLIAKRNQGEKELAIDVDFDGPRCNFGERKLLEGSESF